MDSFPLVSVITPVYNGELYLRECIESVLGQTYQNWEYFIVNNCSTDKTLEIAQYYASQDKRIKVMSNDHFVGVVENHNIAFSCISRQSTYCKVVSADDWIYPECITRMVELGERDPGIGLIGSYAVNAHRVRWFGLPCDTAVFCGREICRLYLLGEIGFFGVPTTVLYRSAIVRSGSPFFPGSRPNADVAACLNILQTTDFGFVHQVLSFERIHNFSINASLNKYNSFRVDPLEFLIKYGHVFLTRDEFANRLEQLLDSYYVYLAGRLMYSNKDDFWQYHKGRLEEIGLGFDYRRLVKATLCKVANLVFNPKMTLEKIIKRLRGKQNALQPEGTGWLNHNF